ncbi:MAG: SPOR domain-containing protein [Proteobacteria bacterium]|nr:SPOR domain-containing protein [Pseudomonadota bacterium]
MAIKKTSRKKTQRKVAGRTSAKRRTPGWIIMLSGMLIGLLLAALVYINGWVPKPDLEKNVPIAQKNPTSKDSVTEDESVDLSIVSTEPFDFYETLPGMEVVIDKKDINQAQNRQQKSYLIQLGAFRNIQDAESLKAQVAFIGYTAEIQNVTDVNQVQWHRVRLGPYDSGRKADVIKRKMQSNGFNALILEDNT